jgi:uncharacterized membrane protein YbhN (UPF0104 family)
MLPHGPGHVGALVGAVLVYALATVLRSERWRLLLIDVGASPGRADCYALTAVGYMGNNVLPARAGDVMRVSLMAPRADTRYRDVISTLVAERVLDVATLLAMFVVVAYGLLRGVDVPAGGRLALAVGVGALLVAAAAVTIWALRHSERVRRLRAFVAPMLASTRRLRGRHAAALGAITFAIWLLEAATWYAVGVASRVGMSPLEAVYLVSLASVFVLIPSGPGYVGTLDAAVVFGVKAIGGSGRQAVSYLLLLRFVLVAPITLVGIAMLVLRYGGWARSRAAAEGARG